MRLQVKMEDRIGNAADLVAGACGRKGAGWGCA